MVGRGLLLGLGLLASACGGVLARAETAPLAATATPAAAPTVEVTTTPVPTATPAPSATPTPNPTTALPARVVATATAAVAAPSGAARVIARGAADRRFVALSFDAGADVGYTTQILDTLRDRRVAVSFGMTGAWAERNPDLVRRMAAEGHDFINHTWNHDSFTGASTGRGPMGSAERGRQLERTEEIVRALTGKSMKPYFRPPYGDYDASVNADVGAQGYAYNVMWTVDSLGWRGWSAPAIVERCLSNASPGAILIFHVGSQSQDGVALPAILDGLQRQGYTLGSVRQLLEG